MLLLVAPLHDCDVHARVFFLGIGAVKDEAGVPLPITHSCLERNSTRVASHCCCCCYCYSIAVAAVAVDVVVAAVVQGAFDVVVVEASFLVACAVDVVVARWKTLVRGLLLSMSLLLLIDFAVVEAAFVVVGIVGAAVVVDAVVVAAARWKTLVRTLLLSMKTLVRTLLMLLSMVVVLLLIDSTSKQRA